MCIVGARPYVIWDPRNDLLIGPSLGMHKQEHVRLQTKRDESRHSAVAGAQADRIPLLMKSSDTFPFQKFVSFPLTAEGPLVQLLSYSWAIRITGWSSHSGFKSTRSNTGWMHPIIPVKRRGEESRETERCMVYRTDHRSPLYRADHFIVHAFLHVSQLPTD